ncbi:hypothetical protein SB816_23040, partial [Achromobacter sp. SIMBA_011]|uniref:hypothetical protein n=1 Tax=Achromobacter sp. SIMBA_011 TaxID=3085759 RepID=UPI00397CD927
MLGAFPFAPLRQRPAPKEKPPSREGGFGSGRGARRRPASMQDLAQEQLGALVLRVVEELVR